MERQVDSLTRRTSSEKIRQLSSDSTVFFGVEGGLARESGEEERLSRRRGGIGSVRGGLEKKSTSKGNFEMSRF
jgi:hypothetical protein